MKKLPIFHGVGDGKFIVDKELIAVVPPELKAQFDQMQLKNSLFRLKLFGIITVLFNALNWPIYIIRSDEISPILFCKLIFADLRQLLVTLLFFLLTGYFSKKGKHSMLWFMCHLFVVLYFFISAYSMLFAKIFISFLVLWYLTLAGLLAYKSQSFIFGGPQVFALNIFLIAHPMSEHSKHVTVSIGMASTIPDDQSSQAQLLDEADKALYTAKNSGRNKVEVLK